MPISSLELRGGHVALDFVNTVAWRGDPGRTLDHLTDYSALLGWAAHAGVLDTVEVRRLESAAREQRPAAARALRDAKRLREALHGMWTGDTTQLDVISAANVRAAQHRRLSLENDAVGWSERGFTLQTPTNRIVIAAVELATTAALSAVRSCGDADCGWLFLDVSPRRNRRWCSTADCGNRARVRRHYLSLIHI